MACRTFSCLFMAVGLDLIPLAQWFKTRYLLDTIWI